MRSFAFIPVGGIIGAIVKKSSVGFGIEGGWRYQPAKSLIVGLAHRFAIPAGAFTVDLAASEFLVLS